MKKLYYIGLFFMFLLIWGCDKEDDLTPSGHEKEWMVIEDSDDPLDKLRYEIFRDYGVPTYYNDTIGSEERVDMLGNTYTYYERLKIFYYPGGATSSNYSGAILDFVDEDVRESVLIPVLESFRDKIFARFEKGTRLPAFFFADSIGTVNLRGEYNRVESYYGYNTFAVNLDSLPFLGMEKFTSKTLTTYFTGLLSSSAQSGWKSAFLNVTKSLKQGLKYSSSMESYAAVSLVEALQGTKFTRKEELGFVVSCNSKSGVESIPTESIDLSSYIDKVLTYTEVKFEEEYGEFEPVMVKFRMMRNKLVELGYLLKN